MSGGATGADSLGERYARERHYPVKRFLPDWSKGGQGGPARNTEMAKYATHCIVFWNEKSRGTADMINKARERGLRLVVVKYMGL